MYRRLDDEEDISYPPHPHAAARTVPPDTSWDAVQDLDKFVADVYRYYREEGLYGIAGTEMLNCATVIFTVAFSYALVFFVNWKDMIKCNSKDEKQCSDIHFFIDKPFENLMWLHYIAFLYFMIFAIFCGASVWRGFHEIRTALEMRTFYQEKLRIYDIQSVTWGEVLGKLSHQQLISPFCIKQDALTPLELTNILMRHDNYLIALVNHQAIYTGLNNWIPRRILTSDPVMYCFRSALFQTVFDQNNAKVVQSVVDHPMILAQNFRYRGIIAAVILWPIAIFFCIYIIMRHAEDFRSGRPASWDRRRRQGMGYAMDLEWTPHAMWMFREYNELPHFFHKRLRRASSEAKVLADNCIKHKPLLSCLFKFIKYVAGSFIAVLVLLAVIDNSTMLFVKIGEKDLLWYGAFFGLIINLTSERENESVVIEYNYLEAAWQTIQSTHYFPRSFDRSSLSLIPFTMICQEYRSNLLVPRIVNLLEEVLGVLLCPFLLIFHFPNTAGSICDVIRETNYASPALGDWCKYGNLEVTLEDPENIRGIHNTNKLPKSLITYLFDYLDSPACVHIPDESLRFLEEVEAAASEGVGKDEEGVKADPEGLKLLCPLIEKGESGTLQIGQKPLKKRRYGLNSVWHMSAPHMYWLDMYLHNRSQEAIQNESRWDVLEVSTPRRFEPMDVEEPPTNDRRSACLVM